MSHNQLLVFAKVPKSGANKTRLIPALGAEGATNVYCQLVERTLRQVQTLANKQIYHTTLCFTGGSIIEARAAFGASWTFQEQSGSSLGDRLQHAIGSAFESGAQRVVVIGTDCPTLTSEDLYKALAQLENHDVVIGPALDGGYYLIGLRADQASLFADVDWSTAVVFEQTMQKAHSLNLSVHVLRQLADVDYPEDLLPLRKSTESIHEPLQTRANTLSIIIPTLNEALNLPATLDAIGMPGRDLEMIVVDGGSSDGTVAIAQRYGCKVFVGNPGRANQMNAGAAIATGEFLLFLHADTRLPDGYRSEIQRVLGTSVACGAFPLRIDARGLTLRMIESGVAFRSRLLQMPYGDQALFFRATDFYNHGGFKPMMIMEDYELIARMRKIGRIGMANKPVTTSARRWLQKGILRTTLINQLCLLAFRLGFSDTAIARLYRGATRKHQSQSRMS